MDDQKKEKVIINDWEYSDRKYKEIKLKNGGKYFDGGNYTTKYLTLKIQSLKPGDMIEDNEKLNLFASKTKEQFIRLFDNRENNITEGQINFSYDATRVIIGNHKNKNKITVIPAKAGFGKSSYIYSLLTTLCNDIKEDGDFANQGIIVVTDKIETLRNLENDILREVGYYCKDKKYSTKYTYILESWNKNSFKDGICKNVGIDKYEFGMCSEQECSFFKKCKMSYQANQQHYSPILLMTNARLKQYQDNIKRYENWQDKNGVIRKRSIIIIDEKPELIDSQRVDFQLFSELKKNIVESKNNHNKKVKESLIKEIHDIEGKLNDLSSSLSKYRNCIYAGDGKDIISEKFMKSWLEVVGYNGLESLKAINKMFKECCLYCGTRVPYFKTLGKIKLNFDGFKTYIFDATSELDPDYDEGDFQFLDIKDYKDYKNIKFHVYTEKEMNMSKSALDYRKNPWKNIAVAKWINNNFFDKTYVVTYKSNVKFLSKNLSGLGEKIFVDSGENELVIPHFGDTKGSNDFKDARYMIQIGWNRLPSDEYLSQYLSTSRDFEKWMKNKENITEITSKIYNSKNGKFDDDDINIYTWRKMAVDFEQEVFRTSIRDFTADNPVDIYVFKPDKKMMSLVKQRFSKSTLVSYNNIPEEFQQEKILNRNKENGSENKIQTFIRWVLEWGGNKTSIQEIKTMLDISDENWSKINSNKVVKEIKKSREIKLKREGKGNNQIYYWIIE